MSKLSDNYYLRKCFLKREQVPTQSVMIKTMSPPLASVYFNSMNYKLKVLAGLEPSLRGGGADWYIPPDEIIDKGRYVMKPVKKQYLSKLGSEGIGHFGEKFVQDHHRKMEEEKQRVLLESDINWKKSIEVSCRQQWEDSSKEAAKKNTSTIKNAFHEFSTLYTTSLTKIESLLFDAAESEIKRMREDAFAHMNIRFEELVKTQATMLYDLYTEKLIKEKARLKAEFIQNVEESRTDMGDSIHDINVEKHVIIEKLRQLLESQNLACQVYVALKEKEECKKEIELTQHEHKKKIKALKEQIALKDFEIRLAKEKERKRIEFNTVWQKKVCQVVKKLQLFTKYCLTSLPEHADFFIDMEKLMMLQLNDVLENPKAESLFEQDVTGFHTPVPRPHPFYLFCDKGYKPQLDQKLCPKHCTSSASQLPVIVVNKRCIYAACDNFEKFTNKITEFIHGRRGDDMDFYDDHDYTYDIPLKYTHSQHVKEVKLESSLLQVLQQELPNIRDLPIECCLCRIPYCFCSPLHASRMPSPTKKKVVKTEPSEISISSGKKVDTRSVELIHEREPKWESYMEYVVSKKCKCSKTAKKHLEEHLPAYMRTMSKYDAPDLPNYEVSSMATLKKLVKKAQGKRPPPPPPPEVESKTRDVCVQYSDQEFDFMCTCFSDEEVNKFLQELLKGSNVFEPDREEQFKVVGDDLSPSYMSQATSSFATDCAYKLRRVLDDSPQLQEIFKKKNCDYDDY